MRSKLTKKLPMIEPTVNGLHLGMDGTILVDIGHDRLIPLAAMGAGLIR